MLDIDHLVRQTLGNTALETEVLKLFLDQSETQLALIKSASDGQERLEAAHALVGSARAIGAEKVGDLAAAIERGAGDVATTVDALATAIAETNRFIRERLSRLA